MARTVRTIRRSIRAALRAGRHLVTAVRGRHYGLLVRLYAAIDTAATVRITYRDRDGVGSVRAVQPRSLWLSSDGAVLVTCHDLLRDDRRDFRTDRILIAA
ncbi:WYL domain-containing protein [Streptomyces sp. NPDC003300]|uniref:WYL domain-containing protein n=1 Tax=unclassified Streptomyces TaxID=2593676 RepID=UPI0033BC5F10